MTNLQAGPLCSKLVSSLFELKEHDTGNSYSLESCKTVLDFSRPLFLLFNTWNYFPWTVNTFKREGMMVGKTLF